MPSRGRPSRSGLRMWPYATTTPTSGTRARRRARNAGSLGRSGCSTGTSSAPAAVLTGVGTAVERERPWGLSGCVTTATTSNPSPSKAWREGTANSGVPKKTTRTQSSPAGSGVTSFTYPDWPLRDFFHLASSSPRFTALKCRENESEVALDLAGGLGDRETPVLRRFQEVACLHDPRVDQYQGRWGILPHVDDGHAPGDTDLIRRESHPLGGVHRLEQVVHQSTHGVVHRGHGGGALPQDGRAEQVELADGHCGLAASTERLTMFAMLARWTIRRDSPLFMVTSSSFRCTTSPMIPPEVTMRSPRCSAASSSRWRSCCRRCGRISMK